MSTVPKESWTFALEDYAIQHQGVHVIDLAVSYDYRPGIGLDNPLEYPNFVPIANFVNAFFVDYPNETDFWEILNRKLVGALLTEAIPTPYGIDYRLAEAVDNLSITLTVHPYTAIPYARASTVAQDVVIGTAMADALNGGAYRDAMRGEAGQDRLHGRGNDDYISGGAGDDRLYGDAGNDALVGGTGLDMLFGGSGADRFIYNAVGESAPAGGIDRIIDFSHAEGDLIDLSQIDAVPGSGNDAFRFVEAFGGKAGQLMVTALGNAVKVQADADGDRLADLIIIVRGVDTLVASDFIL
ncbi:MAG: hypothetical protein JWP04_2499 [Belnapia sp.]|nr:hypothetical protein [Belnapia sp.]